MRKIVVMAILAMSLVIASQCLAGGPSVQKLNENNRIDWTNLVYISTGEGAMPSVKDEPNRARAYLKAKGYARMAAVANLLSAIEGTAISFDAIGRDYMEDATIRQTIEGYVKNVEVTKTTKEVVEGDTMIIVEIRAKMFGQNGVGAALLNREQKQVEKAVASEAVKVNVRPEFKILETAKRAASTKPYTSVIIDSMGYKIDRCMSPKIRRADGSEVWGSVNAPAELVLEKGIASYVTSLESAQTNGRCGTNPLIIKAIGRAGGQFNSDPVISDEDATLLLAENAKSGFLDKLNVIIVKDGKL
ncbi:MAG: hypothetical protein NT018_06790 [Armatimonadetes bacterium]|nr:hypothetical protein [Armatimonadota bacterium]